MAGLLNHSPGDIIRWLLIAKGLGTDPESLTTWPIYESGEPSLPDDVITLFSTQGMDDGRTQFDGERQEHHGFQVRIRSTTPTAGYVKAREIAVGMDKDVYRESVTIDGSDYCVHSITRTSEVIPLGEEVPTAKGRRIFTVNGIVHLYMS